MNASQKAKLIAWFCTTHIPDPERGFALMNPPTVDDKYIRSAKPLRDKLIGGGLDGATTRRRCASRAQVPISIAVKPEHRDGWALEAAIDVDFGGIVALQHGLDVCRQHGLWAYAQLSHSRDADGNEHHGGHIRIPAAEALPTPLLLSLAMRIQAAAELKGESYPNGHDLRLPLMLHLRAPGGPTRFPLLLQSGEQIEANDPWAALARLRSAWHANSTEAITAALDSLPELSTTRPAKRHKSKVNPHKAGSVIKWCLSNYDLRDLLLDRGVQHADRRRVVHCPWHDDRSPSLVIFDHPDGHKVCRCFSAASNCPAAAVPYLDAFNLYSEGMTASEAVKQLVDDHGLGQRRKLRCEPAPTPASQVTYTLEDHQVAIATARARLEHELEQAAQQRGEVTVFKATPGLGKTHAAAELANQLHAQGQTVAIVAPSHEIAETEWVPRLTDAFIWQPRIDVCTCYDRSYLQTVMQRGYALPDCELGCPYMRQFEERRGKLTIYQHNHLHLNNGKLLNGYDVIIVDESPLPALLEEQQAGLEALRQLINRNAGAAADPALPLLRALHSCGHTHRLQRTSLRGPALLDALAAELPIPLDEAIAAARTSGLAYNHLPADGVTPPEKLPPLFLGPLLRALEHDAQPDTPNTCLAWDGTAWSWYTHHAFLASSHGRLDAPAVLVLDGSADPLISTRLYRPWPVRIVPIEVPSSPQVTIVQCPVTTSTRRLVQDTKTLSSVTRAVMAVCNHLNVTIDGGISYLKATDQLSAELGGRWLHYGGQRGNNTLKEARTLAIIASPTTPPDAIERKTLALWADDGLPVACTWQQLGKGEYRATDERLEAMSQLHGVEELRQAAHRCRPILSTEPTTLLIFSPWNISAIGFTPQQVIADVPHGNSTASADAAAHYHRRRELDHFGSFQFSLSINSSSPTIENGQSDPRPTSQPPPISSSSREGFEVGGSGAYLVEGGQVGRQQPGGLRSSLRSSQRWVAVAPDDPWLALQRFCADEAEKAGDCERALWLRSLVERVEVMAAGDVAG